MKYQSHQEILYVPASLPYAHFPITKEYLDTHREMLMNIFGSSLNQDASSIHSITDDIIEEDYPLIDRPYSSLPVQIIKNTDINPYHIITENHIFNKKLFNLLQYGVDIQPIAKNVTYLHNHTRLEHSIQTAANIEFIMRNNNFSETDIVKGILTGCLHDIATPSFGDLTMKAFPELKEESGFTSFMNHYPHIVRYIKNKYSTDIAELQQYIENKDIIGSILDIADRLAYTARDVWNIIGYNHEGNNSHHNPYIDEMKKIIYKDPLVFDIVLEIIIQNNNVIFTNKERLKNFLLLRAYMHNIIYLNPYLRAREEYFGLILQYLVEKNILSTEDLQKGTFKGKTLSINEGLIGQFYDEGIIDYNPLQTYDFFDMEIYETAQEAKQRGKTILQSNPTLPLQYLITPKFKSGTHYLVQHNEHIQPLSEYLSQQEIDTLNTLSLSTHKHLLLYPHTMNKNPKFNELYSFLYRKGQESFI